MGKLVWTRERPSVDGWYWFRREWMGGIRTVIARVEYWGGFWKPHWQVVGEGPLDKMEGAEFAGPLPPPGAEGAE